MSHIISVLQLPKENISIMSRDALAQRQGKHGVAQPIFYAANLQTGTY